MDFHSIHLAFTWHSPPSPPNKAHPRARPQRDPTRRCRNPTPGGLTSSDLRHGILCISIYIYLCTYTYIYDHRYVCLCVHTYVYMCVYTYSIILWHSNIVSWHSIWQQIGSITLTQTFYKSGVKFWDLPSLIQHSHGKPLSFIDECPTNAPFSVAMLNYQKNISQRLRTQ